MSTAQALSEGAARQSADMKLEVGERLMAVARVRRIVTFSGDRSNTVYQRENDTWEAYTPCHHEPPS